MTIYQAVKNEAMLCSADGSHVSASWIKKRHNIIYHNKGEMTGFVLYDVNRDNDVFIHMIWVDRRCRRQGIGKKMITFLKNKYPKRLFWAYGNPQGQKLLHKCGFSVGKIPYKECIYKP